MKKLKLFEQKWLETLDEHIENNLENPQFNIQQLALKMHLSSASFYRKVVKLLGISPSDYLRQKRLDRAKDLFDSKKNYSLQELAEKVGYKRKDHFAKIFEDSL